MLWALFKFLVWFNCRIDHHCWLKWGFRFSIAACAHTISEICFWLLLFIVFVIVIDCNTHTPEIWILFLVYVSCSSHTQSLNFFLVLLFFFVWLNCRSSWITRFCYCYWLQHAHTRNLNFVSGLCFLFFMHTNSEFFL